MIEDLIEMVYELFNQMVVQNKVGVIFVKVLCYILCQDLDVIMVGEICDLEMVQYVIQVVMMGYFVFLILYINDVVLVIMWFSDLQIECFMVLLMLVGIMVQCFVCKICLYCCELYVFDEDQIVMFGLSVLVDCKFEVCCGVGCQEC